MSRCIHPLWSAGFLGLLAVAVLLFRLPEALSALLVIGFFISVTLRHPLNGIIFLFLTVPFFLGEPYKSPWFFLFPAMALAVLGWGVWVRLRERQPWRWPQPLSLSLFLCAAVLALPLDLKELIEDLWVMSPTGWPLQLIRGVPAISHLNSLSVASQLLMGVGLYVLTINLRPSTELIRRTILATALVYGALAIVGIGKFMGAIPFEGRYLTLSFAHYLAGGGGHPHRLTALAWNPDYYAQYVVYITPWLLALLQGSAARERLTGLFALVGGVAALALTFQRAAYLVFLAEVGLLALYLLWCEREGGRAAAARRRTWLLALLPVGVVLGLIAVDLLFFQGMIVSRFRQVWQLRDPNRAHLWRVALGMGVDQPLLGVGTGRYAYFFSQYSALSRSEFGPFWGTAHSLYLQIFAEQGLLGVAALGLFVGAIFRDGLRGLRALRGPDRPLLGMGCLFLGGWLLYGLFQYTFYVGALGLSFWLSAGFLTTLSGPAPPAKWLPWRRFAGAALALLAVGAIAWRSAAIVRRPWTVGYEAGFYRWERQPDQTPARWTMGRAAVVYPAQGRLLVLSLSAPLPGADRRPQTVSISLDGRPAASLTLAGSEWVEVPLPVQKPPGSPILLEFQTAYTLNPRRAGVSGDDRFLGVMMKLPRWQ